MDIEELYTKYKSAFYVFVYKRISNKSLAEDVVQEVFTTLCRRENIEKFTTMGEDDAVSYIFRCLANRITDYHRKESSSIIFVNVEEHDWDKSEARYELEPEIIRKMENKELIRKIIAQLEQQEYYILKSIFYDDIPRKRVAKELGISTAILNVKISRLRKRIKKDSIENDERG